MFQLMIVFVKNSNTWSNYKQLNSMESRQAQIHEKNSITEKTNEKIKIDEKILFFNLKF